MNKCAIYGRVSTRERGQDVENQLAQLRSFAATQGWEVVAEYIDEASGGTSDRPQFQKMLADASRRRFDILSFWALDRLSREGVLHTLQYLTRLSGYGVAWRSFCEPYLDSTGMFRDAIVAILATLAKQEKARISERTRAGLERARRQGKTLGRPRIARNAATIIELRRQGRTWSEIAAATGIPKGSCRRLGSAVTVP
jgi:DNA invertase Pin-like site-specific DNA recombinase